MKKESPKSDRQHQNVNMSGSSNPNVNPIKIDSPIKHLQHHHQIQKQNNMSVNMIGSLKKNGSPNGGISKTGPQRTYPQHQQHMQTQNIMIVNGSGSSSHGPLDPGKLSNNNIIPLPGKNAPTRNPTIGTSASKGLTRFQNSQQKLIPHQQPPSINSTCQPSPLTSSHFSIPSKNSDLIPGPSPNSQKPSNVILQNRKEIGGQEQISRPHPAHANATHQYQNMHQRDQASRGPMNSSSKSNSFQNLQTSKENSNLQSTASLTILSRTPLLQKNVPTQTPNIQHVGPSYNSKITIDSVSKVMETGRPSTSRGRGGSGGSGYQINQGQQVASSSNGIHSQTGKRLHQGGKSNENKRRSLNPYK